MKIDLTESERLEKEYRERINNEYEKIGNQLVGKFYKDEYIDNWKKPQIDYLYIHSNKGRSLSGIKFHDIEITRVGMPVQYFERWEEVKSDELIDIKLKIVKFFHLDEIFKEYF